MKIGAQLYTVREYTKDLESFAKTLKRIKDIGYNYVQVSGTCSYDPKWLKKQLDEIGLKCTLTHFNKDEIFNNPEKVALDHKIYDCDNIGIGYTAIFKEEDYHTFVKNIKVPAKVIKEKGSKLMVHNHDFEFTTIFDNKNIFEHLDEDFTSDELGFILDVYWAKYAGVDPVDVIKRYKDRLSCVHLKDLVILDDGSKRYGAIGEGILDFKKILKALEDIGCKYAFVEQDDCYGLDPFECLKRSRDYLVSIGAEF